MKLVLSIDGGGVRGIIPAILLQKLESATGKQAYRIFDLIAGTSTGAIIACGIGGKRPIYAKTIADTYRDRSGEIFKKSLGSFFGFPRHSTDGISSILNELMGDDEMKDSKTRILVTSYNRTNGTPVFFKSWSKEFGYFKFSDVALASSAAPTYFPSFEIKGVSLIDGGMFANNPTMCAYAEAKKLWPKEEIRIVSIGSGQSNITMGNSNWVFSYARKIVDILFDASLDCVDYQAKQIIGAKNYLRISDQSTIDISKLALNDCSESAIKLLESYANDLPEIPIKFLK